MRGRKSPIIWAIWYRACRAGAEKPSSRRGRGPVDQGRLLAVVVYRKGAEAIAAMLARTDGTEERAA